MGNLLSQDLVCPHILEDIVYVFLVLILRFMMYFSFNVKGRVPKILYRVFKFACDDETLKIFMKD